MCGVVVTLVSLIASAQAFTDEELRQQCKGANETLNNATEGFIKLRDFRCTIEHRRTQTGVEACTAMHNMLISRFQTEITYHALKCTAIGVDPELRGHILTEIVPDPVIRKFNNETQVYQGWVEHLYAKPAK